MKKRMVGALICTCGLCLFGCSAQNTSDNVKDTQAEVNQTGNVQNEANQTEDTGLEGSHAEGTSGSEGAAGAQAGGTQSAGITEQDALAAALAHAGVDEDKLTAKRIKKDYEDGKEVYDVEFYVDGKEYDYEISVVDGSILKADFEIEDDFAGAGGNQGNKDEISEEEAKELALAKVPGAKKIQIKRDIEDGKPVYEGEIYYNNVEYEFEIDAVTGKILSWEEDAD